MTGSRFHAAPAAPPEPTPLRRSFLPVGSLAPAFELPDLDGDLRSLAQFRGRKVLLVFFNPGCDFCIHLVPHLAALWVEAAEGRPELLVVTTGDFKDNQRLFHEHGIRCPVLLQEQVEVATRYGAYGTPIGYLIDEQGRIASTKLVGAPNLLTSATVAAAVESYHERMLRAQ